MRILVCISNVPDTTTKVRFSNDNTSFDESGVQWIINPWDELALTRALELKEASGGAIEKTAVPTVDHFETVGQLGAVGTRYQPFAGAGQVVAELTVLGDAVIDRNLLGRVLAVDRDFVLLGHEHDLGFSGDGIGGTASYPAECRQGAASKEVPSIPAAGKNDTSGGQGHSVGSLVSGKMMRGGPRASPHGLKAAGRLGVYGERYSENRRLRKPSNALKREVAAFTP